MPKIRTFIAIEIPDETKHQISRVQSDLKTYGERLSWVKPDGIHLTLKFLGDMEDGQVDALVAGMKNAVQDIKPFTLAIQDIGVFPNLNRPRVLWVGIIPNSVSLKKLVEKLESEMSLHGFPKETRKFSPHLTIARVKSRPTKKFLSRIECIEFNGGEVLVNRIFLMKSDLLPTGAVYTALKQIDFESNEP